MKITPDPTGNGATIVDTHDAILPTFVAATIIDTIGAQLVALEVDGTILGRPDQRLEVLFLLEPDAAALICAHLVAAFACSAHSDAFQDALSNHVAAYQEGRA